MFKNGIVISACRQFPVRCRERADSPNPDNQSLRTAYTCIILHEKARLVGKLEAYKVHHRGGQESCEEILMVLCSIVCPESIKLQ